jgi:hypothetical protein
MTLSVCLALASLLQGAARIGNGHPVADSVVVRAAADPQAHGAGLLLILTAAIGMLQLMMFAILVWMLRKSVAEMKASTDSIQSHATAELRSYVSIGIEPWQHPSTWRDDEPTPTLRVTNTGRTPAKGIRARFEYALFDETVSVRGMAIDGEKRRYGALDSGGVLDIPVSGMRIPEHAWPLLDVGSGHTMFVYGEVWYTDVFGTEHRTEFCRHINWRDGEMIAATPNYGNDFT